MTALSIYLRYHHLVRSVPSVGRHLVNLAIAAVILSAFWGEPSLIAQSSFNEDEVKLNAEVRSLLLDGNYQELNRIADELRKDRPLTFSGLPKLQLFYEALSRADGETRQLQLRSVQDRMALIAGWVKASNNVTSRLALASALIGQGYLQRGGDYANRVSDEALLNFAKSLKMAEELLEATESLARKSKVRDPELYTALMRVGIGLGYDRPKMTKLMNQALDIDPWYDNAISTMTNYLLPQWYGNSGDLHRLADQIRSKLKAHPGDSGYALVALNAFLTPEYREFSANGLSWEKTRAGLKARLKRSPDSPRRLGQLLKYSKLANDRETAAEAVSLLRGRWDQNIFQSAEDFLRAERWSRADFRDGSARAVLEVDDGPAHSVAFIENGSVVIGVGTDKELRRFRVENGQPLEPWTSGVIYPEQVVTLPDGEHLLLSGSDSQGQPTLVSLDKQGQESEVGIGTFAARTVALAVDKQGQYFAIGQNSGSIRRWKQAEVPQPFEWQAFESNIVWALAFSPDGTQLASVGSSEIAIWDLAKRTEIRRWNCQESNALSVAWSPDGKTVATAGAGNEIRLWNPETGERTGQMIGGNASFFCIAFSSDGSRLVGATRSSEQVGIPGEIVVWSMADKSKLATLTGHALGIWKIAISPDDKIIASASADGTIRLWDMP